METTKLDLNVLRVHSFLRRAIKDQMEGRNFARKMKNDGTRKKETNLLKNHSCRSK